MPAPSAEARTANGHRIRVESMAPARDSAPERSGLLLVRSSAAAAGPGIAATVLDHAEGIAALAAPLTGEFVHEGAHQEDAAAADAQLGGVEVRHAGYVEGFA